MFRLWTFLCPRNDLSRGNARERGRRSLFKYGSAFLSRFLQISKYLAVARFVLHRTFSPFFPDRPLKPLEIPSFFVRIAISPPPPKSTFSAFSPTLRLRTTNSTVLFDVVPANASNVFLHSWAGIAGTRWKRPGLLSANGSMKNQRDPVFRYSLYWLNITVWKHWPCLNGLSWMFWENVLCRDEKIVSTCKSEKYNRWKRIWYDYKLVSGYSFKKLNKIYYDTIQGYVLFMLLKLTKLSDIKM